MVLDLVAEARAAGARLRPVCEVLGLDPRTLQRWAAQGVGEDRRYGPKTEPANKLTPAERREVLDVVNSAEYRSLSPRQIVPKLADAGRYVASESTMYRVLRAERLLGHRGRSKPRASRPPRERRATGPNQVWSWDITYLRSPIAGVFFYLYMFVDVWSRKIVAQRVYEQESSEHASCLLEEALRREGLDGIDLVVHSDNGAPMKGATLKATMERLGIIASFSRPRVSDDNPFSEALFKTVKYCATYPDGPFGSCLAANAWADDFERWYHHEHLHSGIGLVTALDRHEGRADEILAARKVVYEAARRRHPERWSTGKTRAWSAPREVIFNPAKDAKKKNQDHVMAA